MASGHLRRIFEHNRWANSRLMRACVGLDEQQLSTSVVGTYGGLGPTLAHLVVGEASYVWRFDQPPERFTWDDGDPVPALSTLAEELDKSGARLIELAETVPDDAEVVYLVEGEERRWPAWVVLGQAIDHGREHRSHVATILTQLGIEPPGMDVWEYGEAVLAGETD